MLAHSPHYNVSLPVTAFIGTYTRRTSMGIYAFAWENGELIPQGRAADSVNPSFLAIHPNGRYLYAVNETRRYNRQPGGSVSAFALSNEHRLTPSNIVASCGEDPCHLTVDPSGQWLVVANYSGGNLAVFPVLADGSLQEAVQVVQHEGASRADPARQEAPHVHSADFSDDGRFLYANDLALDRIFVYRFEDGRLIPHLSTATARGAGPRHLTFTPDRRFVYGMNELSASVTAYRHDAHSGALEAFETISVLPPDYAGRKWGAEIAVHPGGRFLYASTRAHDSIAVFRIASADGRLTAAGHVHTEGRNPRHFAIDPSGTHLLVANQDSGTLVPFRIHVETGALSPVGSVVEIPDPVCILFHEIP